MGGGAGDAVTVRDGASSVAQLEDSVAARENLEFGDDEIAAIDAFAVDGTGARR